MKNILVICALGYATSTMVKKNIEDFLKKENIKGWSVNAIGMGMAEAPAKTASIIVTTVQLDKSKYQAPIIDGIPLISGINEEATLQEILELVKSMQD